jgi:hypothetical protein
MMMASVYWEKGKSQRSWKAKPKAKVTLILSSCGVLQESKLPKSKHCHKRTPNSK